MTTALETITGALRESNLLALAAEPNALQQAEGLRKLNILVASVFGDEVGVKLTEFPIGTEIATGVSVNWNAGDWAYPPANSRLMVTDETAQTIYLPALADNGARIGLVDLKGSMAANPVTLHANGKRIEGAASLTVNEDNANYEWMYRSELGEWVRLTLLDIDSDLPFPLKYDDFFETTLAMRLNPRYGRSVKPETAAALTRTMGQIRADYRQKRAVRAPDAVLLMSRTGRRGFTEEQTSVRSDIWQRP